MRWFTVFYATLPFLPALNLAPGADVASVRLLVPLLAVGVFVREVRRRQIWVPVALPSAAISAFLALAAISLLWAVEPAFALRKALFFATLAPVLYCSVRTSSMRLRLVSAYVIGATVSAIVGVAAFMAQFIVGRDSIASWIARHVGPVLWGGTAAESVSRFPSWFVDIGSGTPLLRAFLPFPDPHTASLFWGMALFVVIGRLVDLQTSRLEDGNPRQAIRQLCNVALLLTALLTTFSRGAYVALLLTAAAHAWWSWRRRRGAETAAVLPRRQMLRTLPAVLVLSALLVVMIGRPVIQRFLASFDPTEGSNALRLALWRHAATMAMENPLFGAGIGGFAAREDPLAGYRDPTNAHSTYLEIASELGIFGLIFFTAALVSGVLLARRCAVRGSPGHSAIALALLFYAIHAFFETDLYSPANVVMLLTFLAWSGIQKKIPMTKRR